MTLSSSASSICSAALLLALGLPFTDTGPLEHGSQTTAPSPGSDAQRCAALAAADFEGLPDAPTRIASARIVDVPGDPQAAGVLAASPIKQYCQVLGYVAPQNKFELRLPIQAQWNQRFHLTPCAAFCGGFNGNTCNFTLARGYASITGNGGHEGVGAFDGVWAANNPALQEDFAWRHNHVITIAGKAITTRFYGQPIARSYMSGCSKGGHAVLMEAQRFPEDFDGLMAIAPVYDLTGRVMAGAWYAQAVADADRRSVLNNEVAALVQKSVLARCGAQAGVDEGLVTDPASCDWRPESLACPASRSDSGCLTVRQVDAIKQLMRPAVNSKGGRRLRVWRYRRHGDGMGRMALRPRRQPGGAGRVRELQPSRSVSEVHG